MSYEKLLNELDILQKGYSDADSKANLDDDNDTEDGEDEEEIVDSDGNPAPKKSGKEPDGDEKSHLGKSFTVVDENGVEAEAVDGTEFVKALNARVDVIDSQLGKAVQSVADTLKAQATQIESLQKALSSLSKQGAGRKSVVSVSERVPVGACQSEHDSVDGRVFMAKAMDAMRSGRITAMDVSLAESSLNRGVAVRKDIVERVLQ